MVPGVNIPQQLDGCHCGVFAVMFAYCLVRSAAPPATRRVAHSCPPPRAVAEHGPHAGLLRLSRHAPLPQPSRRGRTAGLPLVIFVDTLSNSDERTPLSLAASRPLCSARRCRAAVGGAARGRGETRPRLGFLRPLLDPPPAHWPPSRPPSFAHKPL
jgi:hypothetical protein